MRRDEEQRLKEQRMTLIQELRTTATAADTWKTENHESDWRQEDTEKFEKLEKDILSINQSLEAHARTESLARWAPEDSVNYSPDGSPKTLAEYRGQNAVVPTSDLPDVRLAVYKWIVEGKESLDSEEYRVLSKAASGGGFFVPTDLADQIVRAMRFLPGGVGVLARTLTTSTGDLINVPLDLTHGTASWIAESGSYTPSDETITNGTLSAYKAGTKIIVSEELLTDSAFDLTSFLGTEFGERIGALAEAAFISGVGTTQPTGITDASSSVSAATLPAGYVTTLAWAGLAAAVYSVPAQYRANASVLLSDSFFIKIVGTQDSTGAPLWNPSTAAGAPDTLAGFPVYTHPNLAAVGANAKAGIVGDFNRGYWIRRVNGIYMQRQNELHSDSGQVGFRAYLRMDGKVVLADALRIITFAAT